MATDGPLLEGHHTDRSGAPIVDRVGAKISALERRANYLEQRLGDGRGSPAAQDFERAELASIRAGIAALRFHRAEVEGADTPLLALVALVDALKADLGSTLHPKAAEALARAERLLEDWA